MAILTVTTTADTVDGGDNALSLREAVLRANATETADTIRFAANVEGRTLLLSRGQLTLEEDVTIQGSAVTLDGNAAGRVLEIAGTSTEVGLADLAITNGQLLDGDGAGVLLGAGSGLVLDRCTIVGNTGYGSGGGMFAEAGSRLTLRDSSITGNSGFSGGGIGTGEDVALVVRRSELEGNGVYVAGGAIALSPGGTLLMEESTARGNAAGTQAFQIGGGIWISGASATISRSTVTDNAANAGGGIFAEDSLVTLAQSTIEGNQAGERSGAGAGILTRGGLFLVRDSTITGNEVQSLYTGDPTGGGIAVLEDATLAIGNSLVAGNSFLDVGPPRPDDIYVRGGTVRSNGHNIFGSDVEGNIAGDREGVAPARLYAAIDPDTGGGQLALSGGPTATVALRDAVGNPALSGAEPVLAGGTDQRGFPRPEPAGSNPDIGAFELDQTALSRVPSANNDVLRGTAGVDDLAGLAGADRLRGDAGADRLSGDLGGDTLEGGFGDDSLEGGPGLDTASYRDAPGPVAVSLASRSSAGALGSDRLSGIENLEGGRLADRLDGDGLANVLGGGEGDDRLYGRAGVDLLLGQAGADRLSGGRRADGLGGGAGRDLFDYDNLADSGPGATTRDLLLDFTHLVDRIDLSTLDAQPASSGNEAFAFLASEGAAFSAPGQVRWLHEGGRILVEASVDADRAAELQIELAGSSTLSTADFVL